MSQPAIRKNHMDVLWHEYTDNNGENIPVTQASLTEKASIIGRVGIMLLSCGTGCMACTKFHEYACGGDGRNLYSGYWSNVD